MVRSLSDPPPAIVSDLPDRATLSNMSPEFGATASLFPVDARTLEYLHGSGRDPEHIDVIEVPFADALAMIATGEIADVKTIALLYFAKANDILEKVKRAKANLNNSPSV